MGCIFVYATVILLGLDHSTLPSAEDSFATVCTVSYPAQLLSLRLRFILLLLLRRLLCLTLTGFWCVSKRVWGVLIKYDFQFLAGNFRVAFILMCLLYLCTARKMLLFLLEKFRREVFKSYHLLEFSLDL